MKLYVSATFDNSLVYSLSGPEGEMGNFNFGSKLFKEMGRTRLISNVGVCCKSELGN